MASNHKQMSDLLKALSGQGANLVIPKLYIKLTGDIKAALFLNQCVFWSDKGARPDGGFWKSAKEWRDEIHLTRPELDRAREVCSAWVRTEIHRQNNKPTAHYYVNMDALISDLLACYQAEEQLEADPVLTETDKTDLSKTIKTVLQETSKPLTVNYQLNTEQAAAEKPDAYASLEQVFTQETGLPLFSGGKRGMEALLHMKDNGITPEELKEGLGVLKAKGYQVVSPASALNTVMQIAAARKAKAEQGANVPQGEGWTYAG